MLKFGTFLILFCLSLAISILRAQPPNEDLKTPDTFHRFAPLSPAQAESSFVVQDGFRMQLIAAEPLITDPVAMAYDENGRAYVVEMNDYPYTDKKSHAAWADNVTDRPIGKVRLLEDVDGDGVFDKSTIFVDGLSWPSGIACSNGGVYITATPDIWFCKDTDGDGRADERRKVLTGFRKYNVQAIINNPIWGFDHHLYVAGSSNGGSIHSPSESKVTAWRGDFRINPRTETFQPQSGSGRFGNAFDDWGNRFICNIRNPVIQVVLDHESLARNPFFAAPKAMIDSAEAGDQLPIFRISPVEPWRDLRARQWTRDSSKQKLPRSELTGGGVFTSASGLTIYRGDQFGEKYAGQAFLGEVANNVIHRQEMTRDGVVYRAQPADKGVEFVASTDTWFRPVNLVNAPDGTLHVLDMYREYIEHPWSIPDDIHERLDLESGRDRGRIYRLVPPNFRVPAPPRLGSASTTELVRTLDDPRAWWRETAQRLLLERSDKSAVDALETLVGSASARGRIHILWTLAGLDQLNESIVGTALNDPTSEIREQAIVLAAAMLDRKSIASKLLSLIQDSDARVRFRAAIAIGDLDSDEACAALAELASRDGEDPWIRAAIFSSPSKRMRLMVQYYLKRIGAKAKGAQNVFLREAMTILGAEGKAEVLAPLIQQIDSTGQPGAFEKEAFWQGLLGGLRRNNRTLRQIFNDPKQASTQIVDRGLEKARNSATIPELSQSERMSAIDWISHDEFQVSEKVLTKLLDGYPPQAVQIALINAISRYREPEVAQLLLDRWRQYTPKVRESVFDAVMSRKERIEALLDRIAKGEIAASTVDLVRKSQLLSYKDSAIQSRAKELLGDTTSTSRREVVNRYREALSLQGNRERGQVHFTKHCAACHRWQGQGVELGPNLETIREWDVDRILLNVFDPHREVTGQYLSYSVLLKDGRTLSGMISDETATSLTIRQKDIVPQTVLLSEIEQISTSGQSLMPSGFEEVISLQDTADLLQLLKHHGRI